MKPILAILAFKVFTYQIPDLLSEERNDLVDDFPEVPAAHEVIEVNVEAAESGINVQEPDLQLKNVFFTSNLFLHINILLGKA